MTRPALAASRAIDILNFLTAHPTKAFTLSELSEDLNINIASTHAVLAALNDSGYVVRDPARKTYGLGPVLVATGHAAMEFHPAIDMARDEIRELARSSDLEFVVTAPVRDEIVVLARTGTRHALGFDVGRRIPLDPPMGSVFVAWGPSEETARWLARGRRSGRGAESRHRRMLEIVLARGYSVTLKRSQIPVEEALAATADLPSKLSHTRLGRVIDVVGESDYHLDELRVSETYDVGMIAAPVFDSDSRVLVAVCANGFPRGLPAAQILEQADQLREIALAITSRARGRMPPRGELERGIIGRLPLSAPSMTTRT